jgi:carbon-monoxide dehydrogenase large subunit
MKAPEHPSLIGAAVARKEDRRFLTGAGRYTDDLNRPHQTHAYFVRSPHAHAKIVSIDASKAKAAPGVVAVYTGHDLAADKVGGIPCGWLVKSKDGSNMVEPPHPALVADRVRHVGDQVAVVIAESKAQAKAAAHLIEVEYETLPAAATVKDAVAEGAPLVWDQAAGNTCFDWHLGDRAPVDAAFAKAHKIVEIEVTNNRLIPNAMEPRAAIGEYDRATDLTTLWTTSQNPHLIRLLLGAFVLGIPEHKLRVVAPDVGGGFGSKIFHYAEEVIVTWAARKLGRPVKWTAERSESFMSDAHGRDTVMKAKLAVDKDGNFLALHVHNTANMGAYLSTFAPAVPTYLSGTLMAGVYKTPAIYVEVRAVFTNTVPVDAYRGAGRPEATYLLERLVDKAARELGMDRLEIRRKNFIRTFPYKTPVALEYDTGDYDATLAMALEKVDYENYPARKAESAKRGKLRGIGFSTYLEACGIAPSALVGALGARAGLYEAASVRVHPTGSVTVFTGTHSHGQGHETTFAQLVADQLGIPLDNVEVVHGDSDKIPFGMGTYGSRSLSVGGSAIVKAVDKIVAKGKKIAAHLLEASEADIEFKDGKFTVVGTDRAKTFGEIALTAYVPHNYPIDKLEPGLEESAFYDPKNFTYPAGSHAVEVEVDPETGVVTLCDVVAADDVGRIINPLIVDGQMHGGLAQGLGQALLEEAVYDESGQLLSGSFMTYTMPRAADFPFFKVGNHVTNCTHNPIGAKGVGEVGAIGVPPAAINAILDALEPLGVKDISMPATPEKVWRAIRDAKEGKAR